MRQLLSLPAPPPYLAQTSAEGAPKQRPPNFYDTENPPADDASLEDLLDYWSLWAGQAGAPSPSDVTKRRLLDACADDIKKLPHLILLFSYEESTAKRVKGLFDKATSDRLLEEPALEGVKSWLVFNSKFFLDDLYALASKVKDEEKSGYVKRQDELIALARVDWQTAEPLVNTLANGNQPRSAALALTLLYQQAISTKDSAAEEKYRSRLKTIVSDRNAPAQARDTAIKALASNEWSGRDDWYLSLLSDESLRESRDGYYSFTSLTKLIDQDPDKWIPVMTRLVESKDRVVQQAAGLCLVAYSSSHPRRDVILPVLRWLSDPDWLKIRGGQRASFVQAMDDVEIPESVPGLIWIVENDQWLRSYAAVALAHYTDPRVIPVLRKALVESTEENRRTILDALVPAGGISDSEAVTALEAYAAKQMTTEGREEVERYPWANDKPLSLQLSIAKYLASIREVPDSIVRAVLVRAESLKKTNRALAESFLSIANRWDSREIDLNMIQRIGSGSADANTIATALDRRSKLRETLGAELQMLLEQSGESLGIGAVLLDDPQLAQTILTSGNQRAQMGLLVSARLTRTPLPVELIGKLLPSKNALLALTAERYLLAEDSKDARRLLWRHHPNQAFVTGWREILDRTGGERLDEIVKAEDKLRAELLKEDGPLEILALIANHERYGRVLRIYADKAIYTHYDDTARHLERVVSKAELANFKQFVTTAGLADLGPQFDSCHPNCWISEFVTLKRDEAWRVFSFREMEKWATLIANFDSLGRGEGAKIHYELEKQIKGLEVLYADETLLVKDVWQQGDEIRIFLERKETDEELKQRFATVEDEGDEAALEELRRKVLPQYKARFSWRKLTGNKLGAVAAQPDAYTTVDETDFPSEDRIREQDHERQVRRVSADTIIINRNFKGLWKQVAGRRAVRISEAGAYAFPVVTPDGKWVVAAKTDTDWYTPNYVVRFNLQTGQEFRVKLEPADELRPIAFLASHDRVLLRRAKPEYDDSGNRIGPSEHYLLDVTTGEIQSVSGEFAPLLQLEARFLQPTGQPHEYWVALPDRHKDRTKVGRYNLKDFTFNPVLTVPQISFDSMSMWVDESHNKLYVVYENQLVSLPLKPGPESTR